MATNQIHGIEMNDPDKRGMPYVDQTMPDGTVERRYLALTPTPVDHKMLALPGLAAHGIQPVPKADWRSLAFERRHLEIPIMDQDGKGACVGFAGATAVMMARVGSGAPHIPLSPWFIYSEINGGRDAGANAGDLVNALTDIGICEASYVPGMPISPPGINGPARVNAAQYRLHSSIPLTTGSGDQTIGEVLTAVAEGYTVLLDVMAGSGYDTGPDGTIGYLGRQTNHEQAAGEGIRFDSQGRPQVLMRNSWATSWGQQGFGWLTVNHLLASYTLIAIRMMMVNPNDIADLAPMPATPTP